MADQRTYIRVHDGMPDHPKVYGLSDKAFRLLVETWCWCSRHLTDGAMPESVWNKRGNPKSRKELIAAGLAEVTDGGVVMHDYLEHQRSAAEVAELVAARSKSGSFGNHVRHHARRGISDPNCDHCRDPKPVAKPSQVRSHMRDENQSQTSNGEHGKRSLAKENPAVSETASAPVDNRPTSGNVRDDAANPSQTASQVRSQTPRKTSLSTETETDIRPPVVSGGSVGRHQQVADARAKTDDDDLEKIENRIIELLAETTGRTIDRAQASKVRKQLLDDRETTNPLAYVASCIRGEPQRYLPTSGAPYDQPPPPRPDVPPTVALTGAAKARELLMANRRKEAES